jgi:hypothetical protein
MRPYIELADMAETACCLTQEARSSKNSLCLATTRSICRLCMPREETSIAIFYAARIINPDYD